MSSDSGLDPLDIKLNEVFDGRVVRKDLLHQIKKGTNVPTFVLEFLLARYCASNEPDEIRAGRDAVIETLVDNYVRPDEANAAQSKVARQGRHKFIDKVHVRYVEKEKRHWASLENFASQRIAVNEKFYRDNERLLEGGIWAEVTVGYNDVEDDPYAFYIEDLRPIQLSHFDFDAYAEGRDKFSRDEWLDVIMRSVGLEPTKIETRIKFHIIARLASFVEANFNFMELGPRGTGKSYFFSEFSPYSTLISGGQATKAILFYNNARKTPGLVSYWDIVAFDEVAGMKVKDPDTFQIMKDFMANGRFSRGVDVIADASMAFIGNITGEGERDKSIDQLVNSSQDDLFFPLPDQFDLAVMDRMACYLPGWEMPKNSSAFLTDNFGLITDFLAEAFHHQLKHTNRYEEVSGRIKLGKDTEGRDEKGVIKTVAAFLKILHPATVPSDEEFCEYVEYAVECRRRIKEQLNKRKADDEFARINLSYIKYSGEEVTVFCPESKNAPATQNPRVMDEDQAVGTEESFFEQSDKDSARSDGKDSQPARTATSPPEKHYTIFYDDIGYTYETIIGTYLVGAKSVTIEDPYIRAKYQISNFVRFCETLIKTPSVNKIKLITSYDDTTDREELMDNLEELKESLLDRDVVLEITLRKELHDREIRIDNGWIVKIGRGLDFYQKPDNWHSIGSTDLSLRPCLETKVDIFKQGASSDRKQKEDPGNDEKNVPNGSQDPEQDDIQEIIDAHENAQMEFKSSARWNYKKGDRDQDIELEVVITIAGFMNTDGGTLLIGVDDDGVVLGLEKDLKIFSKENNDSLQRWLVTLIIDCMGEAAAANVKMSFKKVEDVEILVITVEPSKKPVFVNHSKIGIKDNFYARFTTQTRKITGNELITYQKAKWPD